MKKLFVLMMLAVVTINTQAMQPNHRNSKQIHYYQWSNPTAFMLSPSPVVTGYGPLSAELAAHNGGLTFYEHNGEYYVIESWADYYRWYVKRYWYLFTEPALYEYYYQIGDDYGMASYVFGEYYLGTYYPSRVGVIFPHNYIYVNRSINNNYYVRNDQQHRILLLELDINYHNRHYIDQQRNYYNQRQWSYYKNNHYNKNIHHYVKHNETYHRSNRHIRTYNRNDILNNDSRYSTDNNRNGSTDYRNRHSSSTNYSRTTGNSSSSSRYSNNSPNRNSGSTGSNATRNSSTHVSGSGSNNSSSSNSYQRSGGTNSSNIEHKLPPQRSNSNNHENNSKRKTVK